MTDTLVDLYTRSVDAFLDKVRAVTPDQWAQPTPCADWNVRQLVNHIVSEQLWSAPAVRRRDNRRGRRPSDGDLLGDDPVAAAAEAAETAKQRSRADGAMDRTVHLSFGDTPAEEYVSPALRRPPHPRLGPGRGHRRRPHPRPRISRPTSRRGSPNGRSSTGPADSSGRGSTCPTRPAKQTTWSPDSVGTRTADPGRPTVRQIHPLRCRRRPRMARSEVSDSEATGASTGLRTPTVATPAGVTCPQWAEEPMSATAQKWRRTGIVLVTAGIVAASVYGLGPGGATASSHREAPLVAADPAVDNTDVYAFVSPDGPDYVTLRRELDPVRGAQRRAELLPVRDRRRVQHLRRQRRRRQAGRHLPLDVQEHRQARQQHVPLQQRPGHLDRRPEPAVPADVHARVVVQRRPVHDPRHGRPGRAVPGRRRVHARLPEAARRRRSSRSPAAGRASPARPTTRSSSTCGSSTCSTAAT